MYPDGSSPDLLLADVGGPAAEVLDDFGYFHPCDGELGEGTAQSPEPT